MFTTRCHLYGLDKKTLIVENVSKMKSSKGYIGLTINAPTLDGSRSASICIDPDDLLGAIKKIIGENCDTVTDFSKCPHYWWCPTITSPNITWTTSNTANTISGSTQISGSIDCTLTSEVVTNEEESSE